MDSDTLQGSSTWPVPVKIGEPRDEVAVSHLTPNEKDCLWQHLKKHHPQAAKEITDSMRDPTVADFIATFEGSLLVDAALMPPAIRR